MDIDFFPEIGSSLPPLPKLSASLIDIAHSSFGESLLAEIGVLELARVNINQDIHSSVINGKET